MRDQCDIHSQHSTELWSALEQATECSQSLLLSDVGQGPLALHGRNSEVAWGTRAQTLKQTMVLKQSGS